MAPRTFFSYEINMTNKLPISTRVRIIDNGYDRLAVGTTGVITGQGNHLTRIKLEGPLSPRHTGRTLNFYITEFEPLEMTTSLQLVV